MKKIKSPFDFALSTLTKRHRALVTAKNVPDESFYNGVFTRYKNPVLTGEHAPLDWRFDLNPATNPFLMERLGYTRRIIPARCGTTEKSF